MANPIQTNLMLNLFENLIKDFLLLITLSSPITLRFHHLYVNIHF